MQKKNIVLIGMPGVGKSTIGVIAAKQLGYQFVDADLLIQQQEGRLLHEIISQEGIEGFLEIEDRVNASIETEGAVIATGGSVVYGRAAMEHLKEIGVVVYLVSGTSLCSAKEEAPQFEGPGSGTPGGADAAGSVRRAEDSL